jgi:hypothetical protein
MSGQFFFFFFVAPGMVHAALKVVAFPSDVCDAQVARARAECDVRPILILLQVARAV